MSLAWGFLIIALSKRNKQIGTIIMNTLNIAFNSEFEIDMDILKFDVNGAVVQVFPHEMEIDDEMEIVAVNEYNNLVLVDGSIENADWLAILEQCESMMENNFFGE